MVEHFAIEFELQGYGSLSFDSDFLWTNSFKCGPRSGMILDEWVSFGADMGGGTRVKQPIIPGNLA
jgi:hypothetical protein